MRFLNSSRLLLLSCAVAGLAGCADRALSPTEAPAGRAPTPSLALTENDIKIPYHQPVIVPCGRLGQEIVPFDGTIHVLFQMSFSASGRRHLKMQTNAQGMTGIGLVSGDRYRLNGGSSDAYEFDVDGTYTNTFVNNFHVESAGATGNIVAHETLRVLVDENGIPTVQTVNFTAECKKFAS
jgi:hypothetical protein